MTKVFVDYEGALRTSIYTEDSKGKLFTDVPAINGGLGESLSPTDIFAASLASCVLSVMGIMAKSLNLDLSGLRAVVEKIQGDRAPGGIGSIIVNIYYPEELDSDTQTKLERSLKHCPVHECIDASVEQRVIFNWGKSPKERCEVSEVSTV